MMLLLARIERHLFNSYYCLVSVGTIMKAYQRSSFSTYNDEVDLCAPESFVLSSVPRNVYDHKLEKAMAAPHAAGVAALVWSHHL